MADKLAKGVMFSRTMMGVVLVTAVALTYMGTTSALSILFAGGFISYVVEKNYQSRREDD